jgi:ceramide glucosyltransferase
MTLLDLLLVLALIQGGVALVSGWRNLAYTLDYSGGAADLVPTVVFCPVKGADADLEANARSLLEQDHPDYRVVFLVDSSQDAAFDTLGRLEGAEVLEVGLSQTMGQKVHGMMRGVAARRDAGLVFVFCDADARFPPGWLRELVTPLADAGTGATTGYRWYVPEAGNAASLVRSGWNAAVAGVLGPHGDNFAWGGSMAIRREVFDRIRVMDYWNGSVSDDYALTEAVRAAGLRIVYVPTCLVPSSGPTGWGELLEFTTRQIRITRVYAPRVWRIGLVTYSVFNLAFWGTTLALITGPSRPHALGWLMLYLLAAVRAELRTRAGRHALGWGSIGRYRWFYRLSPPLIALLFEVNFIASALGRRIVWKGVAYTLISPTETRIDRSAT